MLRVTRKRKLEGVPRMIVDLEEHLFTESLRHEMESMWEIPQIFHFLYLARSSLNMPCFTMYEMERILLIPKVSMKMAKIMTSLLSSPISKAKLKKIPPMPYRFWTNILAHKVKGWYKMYKGKNRDPVKVLETIGVEPEFWNIFPDAPLLDGKDFDELNLKQKVWLLKTVCDTIMHSRKTVQDEVAKQPWKDQIETILGFDRYGARYIYFPQFLKTDLRIYRHCLDNKILSTVKPVKPKTNVDSTVKAENRGIKRKTKNRRKSSRYGTLSRVKRSVNTKTDNQMNDCKCSSDSATGSLINEDTNMSSTSMCSNNNNSNNHNNNHINLDTINGKRSRSLSKTSEISTMSSDTAYNNVKSSGYDTNSSVDKTSNKRSSQKMFKGFSSSSSNKCSISKSSGLLNDLKTETKDEKLIVDADISLTQTSQGNLEGNSTRQYLDTMDNRMRDESTERSVDNLSSSSKTDDEKLNEIIGAESSKMNEERSSKSFTKETTQISTTSKSDDEKLSETKTTPDGVKENDDGEYSEATNHKHWTDELGEKRSTSQDEKKETIAEYNGCLDYEEKSNDSFSSERETMEFTGTRERNDSESSDEKDLALTELRSLLQKEAMEDLSLDEEKDVGYNLRKPKEQDRENVDDFNEMLVELGVSKFQLVADSVESLRKLISSLSQKSENANSNNGEPASSCEAKLIKKLVELLSSVETRESALRNTVRRARVKLTRELTEYKEGSVEDQDSSGEGGLSSNWWVLGSQGCPISTPGDGTLQTLPQSTLSSVGTQHVSEKCEDREEAPAGDEDQGKHVDHESREVTGGTADNEAGPRSEGDEDHSQESTRTEEEDGEKSKEEETEQQTRRVLRARGISSYTEQLYSDDEVEENQLEEWADVEAVYAAPSTQASPSTSYTPPKVRHTDARSNEEDSDQDWILPSSRKRKNKRSSANRRLKSFQQKLQSIKTDALQEATDPLYSSPNNTSSEKSEQQMKETEEYQTKKLTFNPQTPGVNIENAVTNSVSGTEEDNTTENDANQTVPCTVQTFKMENVDSVHSELDIKDEGPIFDSMTSQYPNNYGANLHPNYVMFQTDPMNYYVMQPNAAGIIPQNAIVQPGPVVSNIMPPIQQSYYMQGDQNYIVHNPQPNFITPQQAFQPQGPQMMSPQQFIGYPSYVPYMLSPTQPQSGYVTASIPKETINQEIQSNYSTTIHPSVTTNTSFRYPPNRPPIPRQNYPHPNGAVIRSSMPIRGNFPRAGNAKTTKNVPLQRTTPTKLQKAKKPGPPSENTGQKTTSLIVLSDSDDEIEMIITEKSPNVETEKSKVIQRQNVTPPRQKPTVTSEITIAPSKGVIPPQIIQRMSQGGISITPVKSAPPVQNSNTQLVVVVNETGSHYALALPNGSKLILTPEQVAQIRASNGGKLIL